MLTIDHPVARTYYIALTVHAYRYVEPEQRFDSGLPLLEIFPSRSRNGAGC